MSITTHMVPHVSTNSCNNVVCWFPFTPNRLMCVWTDKEKFRIWMIGNFIFVSSALITYAVTDLYVKRIKGRTLHFCRSRLAILRNFNIPFFNKVTRYQ